LFAKKDKHSLRGRLTSLETAFKIGKKYWHKANVEEVTTQNDKEEKE